MPPRRSADIPGTPETAPATPARAARKPRTTPPVLSPPAVRPEERHALIAEKAYLRAERRGFAPGREAEDWLAAEIEVDALLKVSHGGSSQ